MTISEMIGWTSRLSEVKSIKNQHLKKERLSNLRNDFMKVYPKPSCQYTESMLYSIDHEFMNIH